MLEDVDLESIAARERVTRHDVKARIEEFNALAGHEHVHKGMTSRDLTENVEQLQIVRSLRLVHAHGVAVVARLAERAVLYRDLVMAGRSHNVAAQATTLGKRFASAAEEMLVGLQRVGELIDRYPLRGIKGPMGTAQDMLDLFDGDTERLADAGAARRASSWASPRSSPASGRSTRARWTTTWCPRSCSSAPVRRPWHTPSG